MAAEVVSLESALKNLLVMLEARGYTVLDVDTTESGGVITTDQCLVMIEMRFKVNLAYIKDIIFQCMHLKADHCILVYTGSYTSNVRSVINDCASTRIELFPVSAFRFVMTDHYLMPQFRLLGSEEAKRRVPQSDLLKIPRMLLNDPVCRYFDFQKGQVVEVRRRDGTECLRIVV